MPLKEIGGGLGIVDISPYTSQIMQMRQLGNREQKSELDELKKKVDIQRGLIDLEGEQAKSQSEGIKARQAIFQSAIGGDYDDSTSRLQALTGKGDVVKPHPSKAKRDSGFVILFDPTTGQEKEIDVFSQTKINDRINMEAALMKEAATKGKADPTDVTTMAQQLLQNKMASTPDEAVSTAQSIMAAAGRTLTTADGRKIRMGDLPQQTIANLTQSGMMVNAAMQTGRQTNQMGQNPGSRRVVERKAIPDKDREQLTGIFNSNKSLMRDILPSFMEVQNDTMLGSLLGSGTNILNTPIQKIGNYLGQDNKKYLALKTLTGDALFKRIKEESGAAFTENEFAVRRQLMPNETDTLGQAVAKISALVALNTTSANTRLEGLEATDHDAGGLRNLFRGLDLPNVPQAEVESIMNALPPEVRKNRAVMDSFVEVLPPGMRDAFDKRSKEKGEAPRGSAVNRKFKSALGIE